MIYNVQEQAQQTSESGSLRTNIIYPSDFENSISKKSQEKIQFSLERDLTCFSTKTCKTHFVRQPSCLSLGNNSAKHLWSIKRSFSTKSYKRVITVQNFINKIKSGEVIQDSGSRVNSSDDNYSDNVKNRERLLKKFGIIEETQCQICLSQLKDPYTMPCCKEKYCSDCLANHIKSFLPTLGSVLYTSNLKDMFRCPNRFCKMELSHSCVKTHLTGEDLIKFMELAELILILMDKSNVLCPYPNCNSYANINSSQGKKLTCLKNLHNFCKVCKKEYHGEDESPCSEEVILDEKIAEKSKMKKCPKCKKYIQKIDGCNHITCMTPGCNYEFCWLCGDKYDPDHYGKLGTPCYGLTFHGEEDIISQSDADSECSCSRLFECAVGSLIFPLLMSIVISFFSFVIVICLLVLYKEQKNTEYHPNFKKGSIVGFYDFLVHSTCVLYAIAYYSFGCISISLIIITSPIWGISLYCFKCIEDHRIKKLEQQAANNVELPVYNPNRNIPDENMRDFERIVPLALRVEQTNKEIIEITNHISNLNNFDTILYCFFILYLNYFNPLSDSSILVIIFQKYFLYLI